MRCGLWRYFVWLYAIHCVLDGPHGHLGFEFPRVCFVQVGVFLESHVEGHDLCGVEARDAEERLEPVHCGAEVRCAGLDVVRCEFGVVQCKCGREACLELVW